MGLPGFIAWISKDDTKIKRTVDKDKDKLRIMTIHGAKGLQAKVVFIPDTMGNFVTQFPEILFNDDNKDDLIPYIKPSGVPDTSVYIQIRDNYKRRQIEEKKRLLYVAITRAKEAVYICGYGNKRLSDQKLLDLNNINNFYDIALNTFSKLSDYNLEKVMDKMFDGIECVGSKEIIRLPKYVDDRLISKSIIYENNTDQVDFDKTIVPFIKDINENCKLKEHKSDIYSVDTVHDNIGTLYGTLFHKLLEIIPVNYSVSDEVNLRVILTSYMQNIDFLNKEQKQNLINKLVSALNTETVRNIVLNPNSLNEVNISGEDGNTYRLDKLIIDYENKHILIVDYKTNTDAKDTSQEYIDKYKNQLSKYKMIIQNIYPSYSINTGILWLSDFSISMFDL